MSFIENFLLDNKIYPTTSGYDYLVDAVHEAESGECKVMSIYKNVAAKHNTTAARVERNIRTLVQNRISYNLVDHYINNSEVIFSLARYKKI